MNIMIILAPLLSLSLLTPQEHLVPLPLHNGETTNGANWGWLHPETRNGGSLESTGAAHLCGRRPLAGRYRPLGALAKAGRWGADHQLQLLIRSVCLLQSFANKKWRANALA